MDRNETHGIPEQKIVAEQLLERSQNALSAAVEIISPDSPEAHPLDVFQSAPGRRDDAEGLQLTPDQEYNLRAATAELGYGRATDRKASELGLTHGHTAFIEGGQIHKVIAEVQAALEDEDARPGSMVIGASPYRVIDSKNPKAAGEVQSIRHQLDLPEDKAMRETEYSVIEKMVERLPGYEPLEEPEVLPFGYDIQENNAVSQVRTHQFVRVGAIGDIPIVLMRVDRENYVDTDGSQKYRNQPDTAAILGILDDVMNLRKDEGAIAYHTSSTYQASREVDGVRAALQTGRRIGVATYGTERLAAVKGEQAVEPGIHQLPGELCKLAEQVQKLEAVVHSHGKEA